jgi:hypothetical protein
MADRLEHHEAVPEELLNVSFIAVCVSGLRRMPRGSLRPLTGSRVCL